LTYGVVTLPSYSSPSSSATASKTSHPSVIPGTRLLLDSRVVDVPMAYTPIVGTLSSLKPFFFNGLQNE